MDEITDAILQNIDLQLRAEGKSLEKIDYYTKPNGVRMAHIYDGRDFWHVSIDILLERYSGTQQDQAFGETPEAKQYLATLYH